VSAPVQAPSGAGALAGELRRRLGPAPEVPIELPLVSIVVVNHNGVEHLRRLLAGLTEATDYPHMELIVIDNGSSDDSLELLRTVVPPFPVSIVANPHNESFSDANNQGAARARGDLLLFLNNDVEPFEPGWLRELVACLRSGLAGAVGATLIFPHDDRDRFPSGFAVQHRGLRFRDEDGTIGPALHEWEADPLDERLGKDVESPVVVAACLLIEAALFEQVDGFTHGYLYGSEDIDLCLKLRDAGRGVLCSGRALLIHRPGSTRRAIEFEQARERKLRNHRLLLETWGPRLRREHDLAGLDGGGIWVQLGREDGALAATPAEAEAVGLCVKASDPPSADGAGTDPLEELRARAHARGHRCLVLRGEEVDDPRGLEYDVAVHVRGSKRCMPAPGQHNVLWIVGPGGVPLGDDRVSCDVMLGGSADIDAILNVILAAPPHPRLRCAS
jgi:GT2 family glycosyltransferase